MIVGTAGHIDHGKTSLVKALTGVDTDRLAEEKARGITIELGFAYWPRPAGNIIGFVDVPGHERLVHTMLAGATGIDLVLLVVAADDGVMPQTLEHAAIVDLLSLRRGIVVLSKSDLVDQARLDEVATQVRAALSATGLAAAPIIAVSAQTGAGTAELVSLLDRERAGVAERAVGGRFRHVVDRVFSLAGAGTVVTGTVISGSVRVGDRVTVSPAGHSARVRSIHAQGRPADLGVAGDRCALALVGPDVSVEAIARGSVVLDPSLHDPTRRLDATISLLASEHKPLRQWAPVRVHHGSSESLGRVVMLGDENAHAPGNDGFVQLVLDQPVAISVGDRIVLRDISASRTIGGGRVLDVAPPERRRRTPERRAELAALAEPQSMRQLAGLLDGARAIVDLTRFFRDRAMPVEGAHGAVAELGLFALAVGGGEVAMRSATWQQLSRQVTAGLDIFHRTHKDKPGMGHEQLRKLLEPRFTPPLHAAVLQALAAEGTIALDRSWVRLPTHFVGMSGEDERTWARIASLLGGNERFRPPRVRDLAATLRAPEAAVRRVCKLATKRGDAEEIVADNFFLREAVAEMAEIAGELAASSADGRFTVIQFRDRLDNGRKVAIQVLEFFDRANFTMRRGDHRQINPHKARSFTR